MVKTGDIVRFLNTVGGGRVVKIKDNIAYVEDEDGFETPVLTRECVVVGQSSDRPSAPKPAVGPSQPTQIFEKETVPFAKPEPEELLPIEETPEGEKLNIVLAYEPKDLKRLSATTFDTYLVNDSNYFLYFTYSSRAKDENQWTIRYAGVVEPNIQLFLGEIAPVELPSMDKIAFQYVAFKKDRTFILKAPASVELSVDTTKFAKLHCFRDNTYFDIPVLAFELVKNDIPYRQVAVSGESLEEAMKSKIKADRRQRKRIVKKAPKNERRGDILVVDLHIGELVDNIHGLSNADMLNLQVDEFTRVMDENLRNKGQKIVFIHGKGEGVLRNAIMKELNHRYKGHDVQDASFREYGFGATQVTIR